VSGALVGGFAPEGIAPAPGVVMSTRSSDRIGGSVDNQRVTLPVLPLKSGVVLPGMIFTMALESDEARAAAEAAGAAGGHLLLVPQIDQRYSSVGVIAELTEEGQLPAGWPRSSCAVTSAPPSGPASRGPARPCGSRPTPSRIPSRRGHPRARTRVPGRAREHPAQSRAAAWPPVARGDRAGPPGRRGRVLARPRPGAEGPGARDPRRGRAPAPRARVGSGHPGRPDAP